MPRYGALLTDIPGTEGTIRIPALATTVGTMKEWRLRRRESKTELPHALYDFYAVLDFVQTFLMTALDADGEPRYRKEIRITWNHRRYVLVQLPDERTVLNGKSLVVHGVSLEPLD